MNKLDSLIQKERPVIMVPKHEPLTPIDIGRTRYLMAADGLFLESKTSCIHIIKQLWHSPVKTAYGHCTETTTLTHGMIQGDFLIPLLNKSMKQVPNEIAGAITWHPQKGYQCRVWKNTSVSPSKIDYLRHLDPNETIIVDVHSHGNGKAYFSTTDNNDDQGGIRIAMVLGQCANIITMDFVSRLIIEGHFFPIELDEFTTKG